MSTLFDRLNASGNQVYIEALAFLQGILEKYSTEGVCLSFNGGKDCTVILHLLFAVIEHMQAQGKLPLSAGQHIKAIYFETKDQFAEIDAFMVCMQRRYGFELMELCGSFKPALADLLARYPIKAIVMGQRRIDPDAVTLNMISQSDTQRGWPEFARVNPIIDWSYAQVWSFLRDFELPYCELYDQGFTSLGTRFDSIPNPHLRKPVTDTSPGEYYPAYKLTDGQLERESRSDAKNYAEKRQREAAAEAQLQSSST